MALHARAPEARMRTDSALSIPPDDVAAPPGRRRWTALLLGLMAGCSPHLDGGAGSGGSGGDGGDDTSAGSGGSGGDGGNDTGAGSGGSSSSSGTACIPGAQIACGYAGPPGTEGVGRCTAGL